MVCDGFLTVFDSGSKSCEEKMNQTSFLSSNNDGKDKGPSTNFLIHHMTNKQSQADYEATIIPLLARRSCHLPGNSWCDDWVQYMRNNHLLFGICLHHRLHPLEWWERILAMMGSVSFGLVATMLAALYDVYYPDAMDHVLVAYDQYVITKGMLVLWSLGAICHSLFDFFMWRIMACAICHPGGACADCSMATRCKDCGSFMMIPVILALVGLATIVVLKRASGDETGLEDYNNIQDDQFVSWNEIDGAQSFSFLLEYCLELGLAWFVYFPIVGTILFSGILGCNGKLPVLGGRPRDKRLFEEGRIGQSQDSRYNRMA